MGVITLLKVNFFFGKIYIFDFSPTWPLRAELIIECPRPCVCLSVCLSVYAIGCSFFRGLSLVLRSHVQIPAYGGGGGGGGGGGLAPKVF